MSPNSTCLSSEQTIAPLDESLKTTFLNRIAQERKSLVSNCFLDPVRKGITDPEAVVEAVILRIQSRLSRAYNVEQCERDAAVLAVIEEHLIDAIGYARYALQWESLSPQQKAVVQSERSQSYVAAAMMQQPPSPAQLKYLNSLGYVGDVPANKQDASDLIQHFVARKQGGNLLHA